MVEATSLTAQTLYAELVDRCSAAAFEEQFSLAGSFVRTRVKGRDYWYFQQGARDASGKQPKKYVGPDSAEIRERIANHGRAKHDYRERRQLIAMLRRAGFHSPVEEAGRILHVLSKAGVFRMRACVVGTAAYQVYGPMLGVRLPHASLQTQDLDIAQFTAISVAIGKDEQTPPLLDVLREADTSFRSVPHNLKSEATAAYVNASGFRVEILTESRGPEREAPTPLPAIGTRAQPLRFLDFLIRDEMRAAVLHDAGIPVNVPSPERYALHKLIIAQRRRATSAKIDKDVAQAESLLDALAARRPAVLRDVWREAFDRGPKWQTLLANGIGMITAKVRDRALYALGETRGLIPDLDIRFDDAPLRHDLDRDAVVFPGNAGNERVPCMISREALEDHFGADGLAKDQRIETARRHRSEIEQLARQVYLHRAVPSDGAVVIRTSDVADLRKAALGAKHPRVKRVRRR